MKVIIDKVFRDEYKDGQWGRSRKVALKVTNPEVKTNTGETVPVNDRWISTFQKEGQYRELDSWTAGMEVSIEITPKGDYLNFKPQSQLEGRVEALEVAVFATGQKKEPTPTSEPTPDDIDL
jgi:hypothetical protein